VGRAPLFADLDDADRRALLGVFRPATFPRGALIYRQNAVANALYLIAEGRVSMSRRLPGDDEIELDARGPDETFGELALIEGEVHATSARALDETRAWMLDGSWFKAQLSQLTPWTFKVLWRLARLICEHLRRTNRRMAEALPSELLEASRHRPRRASRPGLDEVRSVVTGDTPMLRILPIFNELDDAELSALTTRMRRHELPRGEIVFTEGEPGASCFITVWGAVEVSVTRREKHQLAILGPGKMFGQVALIDGGLRSATCKVRETAVLLELDIATMAQIFEEGGPIAFKLLIAMLRMLCGTVRGASAEVSRLAALRRAQGDEAS